MDATETYLCRPADPEIQVPTNFPLSTCDQIMPKVHARITSFYALPDSSPTTRREIVDKLKGGLEKLVSQVPCLAGKISIDSKTHRASLDYLGDEDGIYFLATGVENVRTDLPSYAALDNQRFAPWLLPKGSTYPESLINAMASYGGHTRRLPASIFQLTFIEGGLILTAALHHFVVDGPSVELVFRAWVAHCHGSSIPLSTDRSFISRADKPSVSETKALEAALAARGCAIESTKPDPNNSWSSLLSAPMKSAVIAFSRTAIEKLRDSINESNADVRVSTSDCVQALIWTELVRANLASATEISGQQDSKSIFPISFRNRRIPEFPTNLIGNSFFVNSATLPVSRLIERCGLVQAAIALRKSIESVDEAYYATGISWLASLDEPTTRTWLSNPPRKLDAGFTSWAGMSSYSHWDFGFGCAQALRPPVSPIPYVVLLPSKPLPDASGASMEAVIGASEVTLTALLKEEEFLHYVAANEVDFNIGQAVGSSQE
ncbi:hypothetical protein Q7P35_007494 [Cladosporium inversicolor]